MNEEGVWPKLDYATQLTGNIFSQDDVSSLLLLLQNAPLLQNTPLIPNAGSRKWLNSLALDLSLTCTHLLGKGESLTACRNWAGALKGAQEVFMSILFVLLTFLLILTVSYLYRREETTVATRPAVSPAPKVPRMQREYGFEVPRGYCFHPGHTWVLDEGRQMARVGIDSFAANILGKIDRIEVVGLNRWVRQGQKLMTVTHDGSSVDMLSPMEGVVTSINPHVLQDSSSVAADPYKEGWICVIKAPDTHTNLKNLVQGPMVAPWMQNCLARLNAMTTAEGATAQDGGTPIAGLLNHVSTELRQRIVKEFFLT